MESGDRLNTEAAFTEEAGITIKLDAFEGPLDLLLHLIRSEELDIWNIPIARITEQYLEYLQIMKDLNINVAGEWLLMASTLIYIKSKMLLPPEPGTAPEDEAKEDPRKELVYQLLEHQKFKNAAQMLYTREEVEDSVWHKPPHDLAQDEGEVVAVTLFDLVRAFHEIVRQFDARRAMEVSPEEISIEEKMEEIRRLFLVHETILFSALFAEARSKRHLIVAFLALLELSRMHEIWIYQKKVFDEIYITKGKTAGRA